MKTINLTHGTGVLRDSNGRIVSRLDLPSGEHEIPDGHSVEEFESFDAVVSQVDWPPTVSVTLSSDTITADGGDSVTITVEIVAESDRDWGTATLSIAEDNFTLDVSGGSATQTLTTTTTNSSIPIVVEHPDCGRDTATLEVVQP